jgi:hypothetical protein
MPTMSEFLLGIRSALSESWDQVKVLELAGVYTPGEPPVLVDRLTISIPVSVYGAADEDREPRVSFPVLRSRPELRGNLGRITVVFVSKNLR